jgi:uncharacterized membrane protein YuzA (DUF378 family)
MKHHHGLDKIVFFLLLIGGLNWGLVGLFSWDLISAIFGYMSVVTRIIYVIIGLAAVYRFIQWARLQSK